MWALDKLGSSETMKILGIETSCDETGAAIVENGTTILSNVVTSSQKLHIKSGGIIPEVAAREQIKQPENGILGQSGADHGAVDTRRGNVAADAIDHQQSEGNQNLVSELGYPKYGGKSP